MTTIHRRAPRRAGEGVAGNGRLTSSVGMLLLIMLAIEGVTVLDVRGMLSLHMFLGLMLIPPVALKSATTTYRFAQYYRGDAAYVRKGPPHPVLRVLGPVVLLSSVALLATGVLLILVGPSWRSTSLLLHKASFIVWVAVMTIHVLGHVLEAARVTRDELRTTSGVGGNRGRIVRLALVTSTLVAGVGIAAALWPTAQHSEQEFGRPDLVHSAHSSVRAVQPPGQ